MQPPTDHPPLYTMNPTERFSARAETYAKYRPSYPDAAIAAILADCELNPSFLAADIGAGTGISTRLLADRGARVLAIEPNAAMRAAAAPHLRVEFRSGTAEATQLLDQSVNLVTCFQAFHWFNPEPALAEFHRILKPAGRLAIAWNHRDRTDLFTAEYSQILKHASKHHPAEKRTRRRASESLPASPHFVGVHHQVFRHQQVLDLDGLIGRTLSASYIPDSGPELESVLVELRTLHQKWADADQQVYLTYRTDLYLAERVG